MATAPRRLSILGGGVGGLSLAWYLRRALGARNIAADITVFESQPRVGGWFDTVSREQPEGRQNTGSLVAFIYPFENV
jgi:protoporphyrinogen oxidase